MSLQTPQLQEFTNHVSSPHTRVGACGALPPCMRSHSVETARSSPSWERSGPTWKQARALLPALAPRSTDIIPSQPLVSKNSQEHFLRASIISWGSQDGEGKLQHPESTALRGKLFAHHFYSLFLSAPRPPEAIVPEPLHLQFELLPCQAQRESRHSPPALITQPRPLPGTRSGSKEPPGHRWGETVFISLLLFSLCNPMAHLAAPTAAETGPPSPCSPGSLCCANPHETLIL